MPILPRKIRDPFTEGIWMAAGVDTRPEWVLLDGVPGTEVDRIDQLRVPGQWVWDNGQLYVYTEADPDTAYNTVEVGGEGLANYYVYQGDEHHLEISDADGLARTLSDPQFSRRWLYGAGVDQVLASDDGTDVCWMLSDHQGTIRDVVAGDGAVQLHRTYDAFGNVTEFDSGGQPQAFTQDLPFAYTGRPYDAATGLYDYRARWYDAAVGRFVSEDPISLAAGDMNLYRYVGNNPMVHVDPSGLCWQGTGSSYSPTSGVAHYTGFDYTTAGVINYSPSAPPTFTSYSDIAAEQAAQEARQDRIDQIARYAGDLGWARLRIQRGVEAAREKAADAWFFPGSANDRAIEGLKAGHKMDAQIEQFRQFLLSDTGTAQAVLGDMWHSHLQDTLALKTAIMGSAQSMSWYYQGHGIQSCFSPLDLVAGVGAGIITAPATMATSTASSSVSAPVVRTSSYIIAAESRAVSPTFVGAGISDTGAVAVNSLLSSNVANTLTAQSLGGLTRSMATTAPSISSGVAGNVLANIAASQTARQASGFTQYLGTETMYGLTYNANAALAANPVLAQSVLTKAEYIAGQQSVRVAPMQYGNAVERIVGDQISSPGPLRSMFQYVGGPGKTDIIGINRFQGLNWDITTNTTREYLKHIARPYRPVVIPYTRPATFTTFP